MLAIRVIHCEGFLCLEMIISVRNCFKWLRKYGCWLIACLINWLINHIDGFRYVRTAAINESTVHPPCKCVFYYYPVSAKMRICQKILAKLPYIKFHENFVQPFWSCYMRAYRLTHTAILVENLWGWNKLKMGEKITNLRPLYLTGGSCKMN